MRTTTATKTTGRRGDRSTPKGVRDDYLKLVKAFALRPLQSDQEHEQAVTVLARLVGRARPRLSSGERDYADALARFVQDYDERSYPLLPKQRTPLDRLKYLMAQRGMTASDLEELLGASQPLVSQILRGRRNLTPKHMRKLAAQFGVSAGHFL
jgi:HTH-type transcriptional regulator/antitoxin HigA